MVATLVKFWAIVLINFVVVCDSIATTTLRGRSNRQYGFRHGRFVQLQSDNLFIEQPTIGRVLQNDYRVVPNVIKNAQYIKSGTVRQALDHYGANTQFWNQRYWINDRYDTGDGPVFLYVSSGAFGLSTYWIGSTKTEPDWIIKAKKFGALAFVLEHRYYGESRPTINLSTENLYHLNSHQALGDMANFVENATVTHRLQGRPWVVFGCSYAGALAAWFRLKYPHLVTAAIVSDATVKPQLDFFEYAEVVAKALRQQDPECEKIIQNATDTVNEWIQDSGRVIKIQEMFNICDEEKLNYADSKNVSLFFSILANNIFQVVQQNTADKDVKTDRPMSTKTLCKLLLDEKSGKYPIQRYANISCKLSGGNCVSISYDAMVNDLKYDKYMADDEWRQWTYQTCAELGFHPTSRSPNQPFGHNFPFEWYLAQCRDVFGPGLSEEYVSGNIYETMRQFGAQRLQSSRIVFSHGTLDPWHPLTVLSSDYKGIKVVSIEGASHCEDTYSPAETDTVAMKNARKTVDRHLKRWLENTIENRGPKSTAKLFPHVIASLFVLVKFYSSWLFN